MAGEPMRLLVDGVLMRVLMDGVLMRVLLGMGVIRTGQGGDPIFLPGPVRVTMIE